MLRTVDELLRGSFTGREALSGGRVEVSTRTLCTASLLLGCIYGICMGLYGCLRSTGPSYLQLVASTVKVPLVFLLTLVVAFPSLYVFSALSNSTLRFQNTLRLLLVALTVNLAVLASLGPVTAFFTLSTESYRFMVLLNVVFFTIGGIVGLKFLRTAMETVFAAGQHPRPDPLPSTPLPPEPSSGEAPKEAAGDAAKTSGTSGAVPRPLLPRSPGNAASRTVFHVWIVIFAVVGAQMGWILRPFIGTPDMAFTWFRARESNFFEAIVNTLRQLLTGG